MTHIHPERQSRKERSKAVKVRSFISVYAIYDDSVNKKFDLLSRKVAFSLKIVYTTYVSYFCIRIGTPFYLAAGTYPPFVNAQDTHIWNCRSLTSVKAASGHPLICRKKFSEGLEKRKEYHNATNSTATPRACDLCLRFWFYGLSQQRETSQGKETKSVP